MKAFRGTLVDFTGNPRTEPGALRHIEDGLLVVDEGRVVSRGPFPENPKDRKPNLETTDYSGRLIMPGFVDAHVHSAQTDIIASHGEHLLDWLDRHTFPAEARFADAGHARQASEFFLDELLRNATPPSNPELREVWREGGLIPDEETAPPKPKARSTKHAAVTPAPDSGG